MCVVDGVACLLEETRHHVDYSSDLDVVDLEAFASEVEYIGTIGIGGHRYQALTASV